MARRRLGVVFGWVALLFAAALGFARPTVTSGDPSDVAIFDRYVERSRLLREALETDSELRASIVGWSVPLPEDLTGLRFVVRSRAVRVAGVTWVEGLYLPRLSDEAGTEPADGSLLGRSQELLREGRLLMYVPGGAGELSLFVRDRRVGTAADVGVSGMVDLALPLLGNHTLVDRRPTDVVLTDAKTSLRLSRAELGGRLCLLIDANTPWGRRKVWIDADRPELVVRVEAETLWNELTDQTDLELWMGLDRSFSAASATDRESYRRGVYEMERSAEYGDFWVGTRFVRTFGQKLMGFESPEVAARVSVHGITTAGERSAATVLGMFEVPDGTPAAFETPQDGLELEWYGGALRPRVPLEALAEIDRMAGAPIVSESGSAGWGWAVAGVGLALVVVVAGGVLIFRRTSPVSG